MSKMSLQSIKAGWSVLRLALQTNQLQERKDSQASNEQARVQLNKRHQHEMAQIGLFINPLGWAKAITRYVAQQTESLLLHKTQRTSILRRQRQELVELDQWIAQQQEQSTDIVMFNQLQALFSWSLTTQQRGSYHQALSQGHTVIITDANESILWTSQSFTQLTGYGPSEVVGKRPQLLQGPSTDRALLGYVREQLALAQGVEVEVLNYYKGGSPYLCHMRIEPLYSRQGTLTHFASIERYVNAPIKSAIGTFSKLVV
ncbi:PAS domain-containing protein [Spirosoma flavum]|uniref:PAS domain-containing protein n=1 Tax=Spirosoma flavum TaxID=2048557 RepID=A0ABW6AUU6_9BACT